MRCYDFLTDTGDEGMERWKTSRQQKREQLNLCSVTPKHIAELSEKSDVFTECFCSYDKQVRKKLGMRFW